MIHPVIRIASAIAGIVLLSIAMDGERSVYASLVFSATGVLLLLPALASWREPRPEDFERLLENEHRFRGAMFACYGAALLIYLFVVTMREARTDLLQRAASLGAAFWTVGFIVMYFAAYYASRRAFLVDRD